MWSIIILAICEHYFIIVQHENLMQHPSNTKSIVSFDRELPILCYNSDFNFSLHNVNLVFIELDLLST